MKMLLLWTNNKGIINEMKIERIEISLLEASLAKPFGWSQRWTNTRSVIVLKIITDDGIVGWGETYGSSDSIPVTTTVAKMVIGEDPNHLGKIWTTLYRFFYQGHNLAKDVGNAISAIDTALHDIVGKSTQKSVSDIMGGRIRDSITVYATGLYYVDDYALDPLLKEATTYVEQGFTGMKMKVGGLPLAIDASRIKAVREIIGPDVQLMFDANEAYDPSTAIEFANMVAENNLRWFEEPCDSRDNIANKLVQERSPIPTSGGESLSTRWEFIHRLVDRTFDIVQPDICIVGGPSEMQRVGIMAQSLGIKFNPHFWGTGISFAAALHSLSTQPISQIAKTDLPYQNESVLEFDQTPHPIRENLTEPFFTQSNSKVEISHKPGLGIEVDETVLRRFTNGEPVIVHT